jgi:ketosteroid isomerase-like protein
VIGMPEALDLFDRWYAAHEEADLVALGQVLAPDVTIHSLFRDEPVHTRPTALAHFQGTLRRFPDLSMPLRSAPAAGAGTVFGEVSFTGTFSGQLQWHGNVYNGTGERFSVPGVVVLHTDGDFVTSVATWFDRDNWLRQIGILPWTALPPAAPQPEGA